MAGELPHRDFFRYGGRVFGDVGDGVVLQKVLLDLMQLLGYFQADGIFMRPDFDAGFFFWLKAPDHIPHRNVIHTFL